MTGETKPHKPKRKSNQAEGIANSKDLRHQALGVFEEQQKGQCDGSLVSKGKWLEMKMLLNEGARSSEASQATVGNLDGMVCDMGSHWGVLSRGKT